MVLLLWFIVAAAVETEDTWLTSHSLLKCIWQCHFSGSGTAFLQ